MAASFKINLDAIKKLASDMTDPKLIREIESIPSERQVQGLIAQGIADNFSNSGPGWANLKFRQGQILRKTSLLMQSVTTPGATGNIYKVSGHTITWGTDLKYAKIHNEGGVITAKNGSALWIPISSKAQKLDPSLKGEDRKRASMAAKLKYGKDFIFAKKVTIPKREFLVLHKPATQRLHDYVTGRVIEILAKYITGKR